MLGSDCILLLTLQPPLLCAFRPLCSLVLALLCLSPVLGFLGCHLLPLIFRLVCRQVPSLSELIEMWYCQCGRISGDGGGGSGPTCMVHNPALRLVVVVVARLLVVVVCSGTYPPTAHLIVMAWWRRPIYPG